MEIGQVFLLCAAALLFGLVPRARNWLIFIFNIVVIYWFQPSMPIRNLDFWLAFTTLSLIVFTWIISRPNRTHVQKDDKISIILILVITVIVGLNRYLGPVCCLLPTRPPVWQQVFAGMAILILISILVWYLKPWNRLVAGCLAGLLVLIFVILKTPDLSLVASAGLRILTKQPLTNAAAIDIRWIGFSYLAFRLIHILKDMLAGRLPPFSLRDLLIFTIFFPAFSAGPIDRIQHSLVDMGNPYRLQAGSFWSGGQRILLGLLKKFALADSLALIALNDLNAAQTTHTGWMWFLVYTYAFRIYLDFSGYTDIALGLGIWMGFNLPENFDRPYLKTNLSQFWNAWHITLAQWFRAYHFNPFTRWLRSKQTWLPTWMVVLAGQVTTMTVIGLWHGITFNFLIWGLWHGIGLFIHNRWSSFLLSRNNATDDRKYLNISLKVAGSLITFHFVALSWVWFALSELNLSWQVFQRLVGLG